MSEDAKFDQGTYEVSKKYLKSSMEHMLEAGRDVRDLTEFALEKFGDEILPYLRRFLRDVGQGNIDIKGLTQSAKTAIVGHQVTAEERERMIRELAYLRSEQRGFVSGYEGEDWHFAEMEIDERLAREAGLVARGREALASAASIAEKEFGSIRKSVAQWLEGRLETTKKTVVKAAARKKSAKATNKAVKGKADIPGSAEAKKQKPKAAAEKKPAAAKKAAAVKKKAPAKKSVTKTSEK